MINSFSAHVALKRPRSRRSFKSARLVWKRVLYAMKLREVTEQCPKVPWFNNLKIENSCIFDLLVCISIVHIARKCPLFSEPVTYDNVTVYISLILLFRYSLTLIYLYTLFFLDCNKKKIYSIKGEGRLVSTEAMPIYQRTTKGGGFPEMNAQCWNLVASLLNVMIN